MNFACVGDVGIDHYLNQNVKKPGGIAFNVATNIIDCGANASIISAIGSDKLGKKFKHTLKKHHVDLSHIRTMHGKTAKQKIVLGSDGEKHFVGYSPGVLKHWMLDTKDLKFISEHDIIFVPLSDGLERIFHQITHLKTSALKCADFSQDSVYADFEKENNSIQQFCQFFTINFISATEKQIPLVKSLSCKYSDIIFVLTSGAKGSIGFQAGNMVRQSAFSVTKPIDSTGCGDAFQAAFIIKWLQTKNMIAALEEAASNSAKTLLFIGSTGHSL